MKSRSGLSREILERLKDGAISTAALFAAIITSGYGASGNRINRNAEKIEFEINQFAGLIADSLKKRQHFRNTLYRLKKDGLITKKSGKWLITALAKSKLLPHLLPSTEFCKEKDDMLKIVIFDVPEKLRRKRDWLRICLKELGFEMLQKSVWAGKVKIPKEFIVTLRKLDIVEHVDIFSVDKTGSLRSL